MRLLEGEVLEEVMTSSPLLECSGQKRILHLFPLSHTKSYRSNIKVVSSLSKRETCFIVTIFPTITFHKNAVWNIEAEDRVGVGILGVELVGVALEVEEPFGIVVHIINVENPKLEEII